MRREFIDVYADLIGDYGRLPTSRGFETIYPRPMRLLAEAVDKGIARVRTVRRVRPDAHLFLLVNFGELVLKPLTHRDSPTRRSPESIALDIQADTTTIVEAATRAADGDAITAADTLRVLPEAYGALKIKSTELWG